MTSKNSQYQTRKAGTGATAAEPARMRWLSRISPLWLLIPLFWIAAALVTSVQPGLEVRPDGTVSRMPWLLVFQHNLMAFGWWVPLAPVIILVVQRIAASGWRWPLQASAHLLAAGAFMLLYFVLRTTFHIPGIQFTLRQGWSGFLSILPHTAGVYALVAAVGLAVVAHQRAREREHQAALLERQLTESRLQILRAQLHPHFLFNSLNGVSALVDQQPKQARRMLSRLSELLRLAVEFTDSAEIPLTREIDWLERYVELQQIRYEERLTLDIHIVSDAISAMLPPLLLQPLVENAIMHGIEPRPSGGHVEISAERAVDRLRLRVRNDGPGLKMQGQASRGVGLRNTRDRLQALYGDEQQVTLQNLETGGVEAIIELPFREGSTAPSDTPAGDALSQSSAAYLPVQ